MIFIHTHKNNNFNCTKTTDKKWYSVVAVSFNKISK